MRALCYLSPGRFSYHLARHARGRVRRVAHAARAQAAYHLELARVGRTHDHGDGCPPRQVPRLSSSRSIRKHEAEGTTDAQGVPGRGDAVLQEAHMHGRPVAGRAEPVVRRVR